MLQDVNGKTVEPFIVDGTTYLPLRAIAEALGLEANWDDANSTAMLTFSAKSGVVLIDDHGVRLTCQHTEQPAGSSAINALVLLENTNSFPLTLKILDKSYNEKILPGGDYSISVQPGQSVTQVLAFNASWSISNISFSCSTSNGQLTLIMTLS